MANIPGANCLPCGATFTPGARFLFSTNNQFYATLQTNGTLAVYPGSSPQTTISDPPTATGPMIWSSSQVPPGPAPVGTYWFLQNNAGTVDIYASNANAVSPVTDPPVWSTGTSGGPSNDAAHGDYLILQNDGYLCLYNAPAQGLDPTNPPETTGTEGAVWHSESGVPIPPPERDATPEATFPGDLVVGIRVHNMSGFVFRFCVLCPSDDGNNPGYTDYFPAGQYDSINLTGWSVNYGDEITPQINWGSAGFNEGWHAAGQDCFFDPGSSFFGVYNLTGSLVNPTFTYVGRSADPN